MALLALPAGAHAATLHRAGVPSGCCVTTMTTFYDAAPGEANAVAGVQEPTGSGVLVVTDAGAEVSAEPPCRSLGPRVGSCVAFDGAFPFSLQGLSFRLGDGNDLVSLLTVSYNAGAYIDGGSGDDRLTGGPTYDYIEGGAGDDVLNGGGATALGSDDLRGGDGDDRIDARNGLPGDYVDCGPGADVASADAGDSVRDCERVNRLPVG